MKLYTPVNQKKKNPENEKMIFSSPEDLKRMNISFKDKRRELNQFIKMDPFGRIIFDQPRFQSRKQFTDMNVLGSVTVLENCRIVIWAFRIPTSGWETVESEENQITYSELISNCLNTLEYADELGVRWVRALWNHLSSHQFTQNRQEEDYILD